MIIDINQVNAEKKNEFEILYNGQKIYHAVTPFLVINGAFDLDKLRRIQVYDHTAALRYHTSYNYIANQLEELIPMKYLVTKSQKFNQFSVVDSRTGCEAFSIFFEATEIAMSSYVVKSQGRLLHCYRISDGYAVRFPIYDRDVQIGEMIKPQVIIDGKDTYRVFLKDEYASFADSLMMLALYLDRLAFNSSYLVNKSVKVTYSVSYSKANRYYDRNWVHQNFDASGYFRWIDQCVSASKQRIKGQSKKILLAIGIGWLAVLVLVGVILVFVM